MKGVKKMQKIDELIKEIETNCKKEHQYDDIFGYLQVCQNCKKKIEGIKIGFALANKK